MVNFRSLFTCTGSAGLLALAVVSTGCPPPNDVMDASDGGHDVQRDDVPPQDAAQADVVDAARAECPANPPEIRITTTEITSSQTWDCNHRYILDTASPIFVTGEGTTITIHPGTEVRGGNPQSALIFTRGTRIDAQGTADRPIVFTSNQPAGSRAAGNWGGIVLLGRARINHGLSVGSAENQIEGLDAADMRGRYGGSDDTWNCGTMRYVRIEFAGYTLSMNNELNGLTMGACGSDTTIDYVQVHRGADDGVEIFGGTVNVRHLVITQSDDDGLDWDQGWRGNGQFIVISSQSATEADPNGIEADNDRDNNAAEPVSEPTLYNVSVFGPGAALANNYGAVLRRGTGGRFYNVLIQGFGTAAVDVRDMASYELANATPPRLSFEHSIVASNGVGGMANFPPSSGGFDESAWFGTEARNNRISTATSPIDTMIPAPYDPSAPNWTPPPGSPAATGAATPPSGGFFDTTATFVGAIPPGATTNWTTGWTAYPTH